jgi:hypothetical protein
MTNFSSSTMIKVSIVVALVVAAALIAANFNSNSSEVCIVSYRIVTMQCVLDIALFIFFWVRIRVRMTYWLSHFVLHTTLLYLPSFQQNSALLRGPGAGAKDEDARNLLQHIVRRNQGLDINTFTPPPSSFPGISVQLPSIFPVPSPPLQVPAIPGPPPTPQFPGQERFGTLVLTPTL